MQGSITVYERFKQRLAALHTLLLRLLVVTLWVPVVRWRTTRFPRRSVLYAGQAYYNAWYLSRALRARGWNADVLNWDPNPASQMYYHGEDFRFDDHDRKRVVLAERIGFYLRALWTYDVFHFSNAHGISFGWRLQEWFGLRFSPAAEIRLLKNAGKKIVYSNNGCLDGVSQTSFKKWGPTPVCPICRWRNVPSVCSDERNLAWGRFRNSMADYQCLLGGNRADFNDDPSVHEVPEFYCLDPEFWRPDLRIPEEFRLNHPQGTIRLYHAVGNNDDRIDETGVNIKSTHIYLPLVKRLKAEGYPVELTFFTNVPNQQLRFYQAQADIFLDMLTYGFFGATAREGMMLGKPVICFLREEWLASMRKEIPGYVDELPVISATPETVEGVLRDLIANPEKRREIGARSRAFALKWHSADAAGRRFDAIYSNLLGIRDGREPAS